IGRAANRIQGLPSTQVVRQGQQIDDLALFRQLDHAPEDSLMDRPVEFFGVKDFEALIERLVVEQDRPEDGLLCLDILWRKFESLFRLTPLGLFNRSHGLHRRPFAPPRESTFSPRLRPFPDASPIGEAPGSRAALNCSRQSRSKAKPVAVSSRPKRPIK